MIRQVGGRTKNTPPPVIASVLKISPEEDFLKRFSRGMVLEQAFRVFHGSPLLFETIIISLESLFKSFLSDLNLKKLYLKKEKTMTKSR